MSTDIRYIQGKANFVADALSRPNGSNIASVGPSETHLFVFCIRQHCLPNVSLLTPTYAQALESQRQLAPASTAAESKAAGNGSTSAPADDPFPLQHPGRAAAGSNPQPDWPVAAPPAPSQSSASSPSSRISCAQLTPISHINRPVGENAEHALIEMVGAIGKFDIDLPAMADEQILDGDYRRISTNPESGLSFRKIDIGNKDLIVDVSNGTPRPFIPYSWRRRIFDAVHGLGHPGVHRTQQTISDRFVWPSMKADTTRWARECIACQQAKITRHVTPPISEFEVPSQRFTHLNMDLVTLNTSNGFSHLLTIVDRFTRWPVAIPIANITTETVADAFAHGWVATYGVPVAITTDRGSQFTSAIWTQLMKKWGIKALLTAAYHPEANGLVERLHRRLKEALIALSNDHPQEWYWKLPLALLAIRTTLKPDIGASPADLVFGDALALPGDVVQTADPVDQQYQQRQAAALANLRIEVARLQPTPTSAHRTPRLFIPGLLDTATHVFVRRGGVQPSLSAPYEGPFRVISRTPAGFRVRMSQGRTELITLSRLKPAHISTDQDDAEEPQDLDDNQPPSPRPPGRRPGIRTRQPAPTTRQTRSSTRAGVNPPVPSPSEDASSTSTRRTNIPRRAVSHSVPPTTIRPNTNLPSTSGNRESHRRRSTRNIDEFQTPTTPVAAPTTQQTRSISAPADDLFVGDNEPRLETNFFAPLEKSSTSEVSGDRPVGERPVGDRPVGDLPVGDRPVGDRQAGASQAGEPQQRLTSALRTSRPPSGARVSFSDQRHRDPQQDRHYFSDTGRPRPNLTAITASILAHLASP